MKKCRLVGCLVFVFIWSGLIGVCIFFECDSLADCLVFVFIWSGLIGVCIFFEYKRYERIYHTSWYDLSKNGPGEEMEWCQIKYIMECNIFLDNSKMNKFRRCCWKYRILDLCFLFIIMHLVIIPVLIITNTPSVQLEDLAMPAGVSTVVVSIVGIFYQIRTRSRSINRQKWINSIRKDMAELIHSMPSNDASAYIVNLKASQMGPHFRRLELYLNPSERVHRSFLAIVRFMYGLPKTSADSRELGIKIPKSRFDRRKRDKNGRLKDWLKWQTKAIRLANVLLKREWEQVKLIK